MTHKLGVYWSPGHKRPSDLDYMRHLQPPVVRILDPDVDDLRAVWSVAPDALILVRYWWLDDGSRQQHAAMVADPVGTAHRHAAEWRVQLQRLGALGNPQVIPSGVNEPDLNSDHVRHAAVAYNKALLYAFAEYGQRGGALNAPVGHPAHLHEGEPDWRDYLSLGPVIEQTNSVLVLHEYWQQEGPQKPEDWTWLAGRHLSCPLGVPIVIGEAGVDGGIYNRYPQNVGYRGVSPPVPPEQYAEQLVWYHNHCDPRVIGICPFTTDYRDNHWASFDTEPAHGAILARLPLLVSAPPEPSTPPPLPTPEPPIHPPDLLPGPEGSPNPGQWPVPGGIITGRFGQVYEGQSYPHQGLDIGAVAGTPILAIWDGIVKWADWDDAYGFYVRIWHATQRVHSFMAHMREAPMVDAGDEVQAGQTVGYVGSTGNSTGPHCHLELRTGHANAYMDLTLGYEKGRCNPEALLWSWGVRADSAGAGRAVVTHTAAEAPETGEVPF